MKVKREHQVCTDADLHQYIPTDRGWAWVIVAGCFGVCALVVGSVKSFGVLLVELSRKFNVPASSLTFSHSLAGFFHLSLAPVANALSSRFSHRIVVITGTLFASIGLITTSFVTSIGWVYLTYGVIGGIGFGLSFSPAITLQGLHFRERRALANGISASGSGAGCVILPNVIRFLMNIYGLSGCLILLGGIILNTCVFACLFRPFDFWRPLKVTRNKNKSYEIVPADTFDDVPKKDHPNGITDLQHPLCTSSLPCLRTGKQLTTDNKQITKADSLMLSSHVQKKQNANDRKDFIYLSIESFPSLSSFQITDPELFRNGDENNENKRRCGQYIQCHLLKKPMFLILCCAICLNNMSQHLLFNVIPSVANELGHSDEAGAVMVAIVGVFDLAGRIGSGWFSDLKLLERKTILHINSVLFAILFLISPHISSYIGLCILSALLGITSGACIGIQVAVLADKLGVHFLSNAVGFALFFTSIALLVNPFLAGVVRDTTGSWVNTLYIGVSACSISSLVLCLEILIRNKGNEKNSTSLTLPEETTIHVTDLEKEKWDHTENKA